MKTKTCLVSLMVLMLALTLVNPANAALNYSPIRIRFQTGATSAIASGQLAARQSQDYVLRALAGQVMQVTLWPDANARLSIWSADGTQLKAPEGEVGWQGTLPKTQDYTIRVSARGQTLSYCLRMTVFGRIQFAPGGTSAIVSSPQQQCASQSAEVVGGYALRAAAGQTMRVSISSLQHNTFLTITGADGRALKSYDDWNTSWQGVLPATQDYYLQPVSVGADSRFTINVTIDPLPQPAAARIRFAPGAESATVSGHLSPGASARYVLWAARGQRMELQVWPAPSNPPPAMLLSVAGPNGQVWQLPLNGVIEQLPAAGDYTIALTLKPGSPGANYTMEVRIPAR